MSVYVYVCARARTRVRACVCACDLVHLGIMSICVIFFGQEQISNLTNFNIL